MVRIVQLQNAVNVCVCHAGQVCRTPICIRNVASVSMSTVTLLCVHNSLNSPTINSSASKRYVLVLYSVKCMAGNDEDFFLNS